MAKKPEEEKVSSWDLALAFNAWFRSSYVSVDTVEALDLSDPRLKERDEVILLSDKKPDMEATLKVSFDKLSDRAKEIINTISFAPDEVLKQMESKGRIRKKKVEKFFRRKWGVRIEVKKAIKEIQEAFLTP